MIIDQYIKNKFWSKVNKLGSNECWIWQGSKTTKGYGVIFINKKRYYAHRISFLIHFGEIEKEYICHHCDNPPCVNPNHLFNGSAHDNYIDALEKNRFARLISPSIRHEIRELYLTGKYNFYEISNLYNIATDTVRTIIYGKTEYLDDLNNLGNDYFERLSKIKSIHHSFPMNIDKSYGFTSKFRGVSYSKREKLWRAEIRFHRKLYFLGNFHNEVDAAKVYNEMAFKLRGKKALLNILDK